jgi:hypothetical protein
MALENNVALINHDHAGIIGGTQRLPQVNTHQSADTDSSTAALHHTLGSGSTQAAQGNHTHTSDARLTTGVSARFYGTAVQSVGNGVNFVFAFALPVRNPNALVTPGTSSGGNSYRLNKAGIWAIHSTVRFAGMGGGEAYAAIQVNGYVLTASGGPFAGIVRTFNLNTIDQFVLNDVITINGYQSSGATASTQPGAGEWNNINLVWLHD